MRRKESKEKKTCFNSENNNKWSYGVGCAGCNDHSNHEFADKNKGDDKICGK